MPWPKTGPDQAREQIIAGFCLVAAVLQVAAGGRLWSGGEDGRPAHGWFQARDDFDALLTARVGAGRVLATAFGVLAPLTASVVTALLT